MDLPQQAYSKKNLGFTLIEILIALSIFSIIGLITATALHTVFTSQAITQKHAAQLNHLQITFLLLSRDLEQSIDRPIVNAKNQIENAFIGTPQMILFTHSGLANPAYELQRSTLQRTRYSLSNDNLIRETWAVLDQAPTTLPSQRILLTAVTDLHFEYLDSNKQFQKNWPPADQSSAQLPRAVRVVLTLENGNKISQLYLTPG